VENGHGRGVRPAVASGEKKKPAPKPWLRAGFADHGGGVHPANRRDPRLLCTPQRLMKAARDNSALTPNLTEAQSILSHKSMQRTMHDLANRHCNGVSIRCSTLDRRLDHIDQRRHRRDSHAEAMRRTKEPCRHRQQPEAEQE
jgi:hypothetical protein